MPTIPFLRILTITAIIMSIPFIAIQITPTVQWSASDFVLAGSLIFTTMALYHTAMHFIRHSPYRIVGALIIIGSSLLVWLELAVGVIGTPWAGN